MYPEHHTRSNTGRPIGDQTGGMNLLVKIFFVERHDVYETLRKEWDGMVKLSQGLVLFTAKRPKTPQRQRCRSLGSLLQFFAHKNDTLIHPTQVCE